MKRVRFSLTLRIFLTTSALLIAACAVTYGAIAYLTPITYTAILEDERGRRSDELVAALEQVDPDASGDLVSAFVRDTDAEALLTDDQGRVLYDTAAQAQSVYETSVETSSEDVALSEDFGTYAVPGTASSALDDVAAAASEDAAVDVAAEAASEMVVEGGAVVQDTATEVAIVESDGAAYSFAFADGTEGFLTVRGGTRAVNQAVEALGRVLPFLVGVVLLISLAGSFFYARFITRPIVAISGIARRMAALDFEARWTTPRSDEIGDLGGSLNLLSDNLSAALGQLEDANRKLRSDIDRERELERQRMAFFSAASHELKTPITILKGQLSGMLARVGIYQDREKYLARALAVTDRMEGLVQEILTLNRIGAGGFALRSEAVDLSQLMRTQIELDRELMEQRGLRLETEIEPAVTVRGDAALLARVLDNVLMNAILYSPEGATVAVTVAAGGCSVENTGVHLSEEALAQLFTPFYRVEQSRNRKSGGSGLGLYLVKSILDLHGAVCGMENTDRGVRFSAHFPEG